MIHTTRNSILLFFGLFGLVILFVYISGGTAKKGSSEEVVVEKKEVSAPFTDFSAYDAQVKNALITVPDTNVKISLVDGRASYGTNSDGGDVTLIRLIGGEKTFTGSTHIFADIAVQSGGTGVFHYVALFDVSSGIPVYSSAHFIGDRVVLSSVSTTPKDSQSYLLNVQYLERREGDAMVEEPSVPKEKTIEVRAGAFVEEEN